MSNTLDLSALAGKHDTIVLSGKERGADTRRKFGLDELDQNGPVDVILPHGVSAITPSFVLGMFGTSVKRCGSVDSFLSKYHFTAPDFLVDQIRRGAHYSLVRGTALPF